MAKDRSAWLRAALWGLALLLMVATAAYQRLTGPTHPARGSIELAGQPLSYKLIRSENSGTDAAVSIPDRGLPATLRWKRYRTSDPWSTVAMTSAHGALEASLPSQPPAGKLEYYLVVDTPDGHRSIPNDETVVIRFKGAVPAGFLIPHILCMFLGVMLGLRTMLEVLARGAGLRWMAWTTLLLIGLGGMILGPIVQLYAFGDAWTGVPFGWDLTDNKTLVMFLAWLGALAFVRLRGEVGARARWATLAAAVVMIAVYLVPHSMFGSELDYDAVDQGLSPDDAVKVGPRG